MNGVIVCLPVAALAGEAYDAAVASISAGDPAGAIDHAVVAVAIARADGDRSAEADALLVLAGASLDAGDADTADGHLEAAGALLAVDDPRWGAVYDGRGLVAAARGDSAGALRIAQESVARRRASDSGSPELAASLVHLGRALAAVGQAGAGADAAAEALRVWSGVDGGAPLVRLRGAAVHVVRRGGV